MLLPTSSANSRTVKDDFDESHHELSRHGHHLLMCRTSRPGIFTDQHSALFKKLKPLIALRSAHTVPACLVKQLKCLCKIFRNFATKFHTHTHVVLQILIVTLLLIRRTACTNAKFSGSSSTTNDHRKMELMAVC